MKRAFSIGLFTAKIIKGGTATFLSTQIRIAPMISILDF